MRWRTSFRISPLGFASLILRPAPARSAIERFLIVDAEDETSDGGAAFVLLIGARGRSALPALRRLLKNPPPVVAVKGMRGELTEAEKLLRGAARACSWLIRGLTGTGPYRSPRTASSRAATRAKC